MNRYSALLIVPLVLLAGCGEEAKQAVETVKSEATEVAKSVPVPTTAKTVTGQAASPAGTATEDLAATGGK